MHTTKTLPDFLREEVREWVIEFERATDQHLTEREMAIFSFGFEYGQRHVYREQNAREIRKRRAERGE